MNLRLPSFVSIPCLAVFLILLILGLGATAQEKPDAGDTAKKAPEPEASTESVPRAELEKLEKRFRETLTGATLAGRWRLVKGGELGEEREEKYSISAATKVGGDVWLITARIQYAGKDVTLPVPVKVLWAGDTPIVTVTDAGIPGLGTYTARVMFYRDLYTGTWFGPGHGGLMSGSITRTKPETAEGAGKEE